MLPLDKKSLFVEDLVIIEDSLFSRLDPHTLDASVLARVNVLFVWLDSLMFGFSHATVKKEENRKLQNSIDF